MKSVDLLIYDLDGTLIDSRPDIVTASNRTLSDLDLPPKTAAQVSESIGRGVQNLVRGLIGTQNESKFEAALKCYKRHYAACLLDQTALYPEVREVLDAFKSKKQVVISNKPHEFSVQILKGLGVLDYFEIVIGGDSVHTKKPSPESIFHVLNELNITPEKSAMIGDSAIDVETGRNAKVTTCAVTYGYGDQTELRQSKPEFLIDRFGRVLELFR